jgi:hypothetical protein
VAGSSLLLLSRSADSVRTGNGHRVERIGDRVQMTTRQMQIDYGVFEFDVTEQQLDGPEVRAGFEQVCGIGMPPM